MRSVYSSFYSNKELNSIRDQDSILAVDANVLLELYALPPKKLQERLQCFQTVRNRLYLPYQAGLEYHRNLNSKLHQIEETAVNEILELFQKLKNVLPSHLSKANPLRDLPEWALARNSVLATITDQETMILNTISDWRDKLASNSAQLKEQIAELFPAASIGTAPDAERVTKWCELGKLRYMQKIPPGFNDGDKKSGNPYGDLFIWFELIECAKALQRPVIFLTLEQKSDWVVRTDRNGIAREDLVAEFQIESGQLFEIMTPEFLCKTLQESSADQEQQTNQAIASTPTIEQPPSSGLTAFDETRVTEILVKYLTDTYSTLSVASARELIAGFFGYQTYEQLILDFDYPVDWIGKSETIILDIAQFDDCRKKLSDLPSLPISIGLVFALVERLRINDLLTGEVWTDIDLSNDFLEDFICDHVDIEEEVSRSLGRVVISLQNLNFLECHTHFSSSSADYTLSGTAQAQFVEETAVLNRDIEIRVFIELDRIAGKIGFESSEFFVYADLLPKN